MGSSRSGRPPLSKRVRNKRARAGERLRMARSLYGEEGITQAALGELLGVPVSNISDAERGVRAMPKCVKAWLVEQEGGS